MKGLNRPTARRSRHETRRGDEQKAHLVDADDEEMGKPSGVREHSRHGGLKGLKIVNNQ